MCCWRRCPWAQPIGRPAVLSRGSIHCDVGRQPRRQGDAILEPKLFKPSIDWSTATTESLWWLARGWLIAAVCVVVVLVLLRYLTGWGRQYWRITGGYFTGRHAVRTWVHLAALLFLVLLSVRLTVLLSYQSNDLYSSLQTAFEGTALGN